MKRLIKRILKAAWRTTFPLRRPAMVRLEAYLRRLGLSSAHAAYETHVLLDHVVRELIRLQDRIDRLQETVDDLAASRDRLSIVDESGERMKAV